MRRLLSLVLVLTLLLPCFGAAAADAPLLLRGQEVAELYSFDYQNRAYHRVTGAADIASLTKALAVLPASKGTEQTTVSDGARGFLAFLKDGTRLAWYVTSKELSDDIGVIPSTQNARDTLLNLAGKLNAKYPGNAQPLAYLSPSNVKWVNYFDMAGEIDDSKIVFYEGNNPDYVATLIRLLKLLEVKPQPTIWRHTPGKDNYYPNAGYGWHISIYTNTGVHYNIQIGPDRLEIRGSKEDLIYQTANPKAFETLREMMKQQMRTQLIAESHSPRTAWSTNNNKLAEKIRGLTRQRSGKAYTEQEFAKMRDSLDKLLTGYNLNFTYLNGAGGGILYLPTDDSGKGFFCASLGEGAWYLTEQATKELKALMQPMTRL